MCRSAADRLAPDRRARQARAARRILTLVAVAFALAVPAVAAPPASEFELTRGVQRALYRLQESWLQWVGALYRDHRANAEAAIVELEQNARQLGMTRLVDFSLGAVATALEASRSGNFERADLALQAAERLDPGRPETAFARATVERRRGAWWQSARAASAGMVRLFKVPERRILLANARLWLIAVAMVAGALFLLVEVATKGSAVLHDLRHWLGRKLSAATIWLVASVVLLWPLVLPGGPLWLLFYWSALLWGYQSASARAVTAAIWLFAAGGPLLAARALEQIAVAISPPIRAVSHFADGRLYGGLFADLGVLRVAIGDSTAAQQLEADVHRTLGQWEEARQLYRQIIDVEPKNVAALIDLGAYQFRKSDFALANDFFRQAATESPDTAGALYNLSLSFSETYQFEESKQALAQARELDGKRVDEWVKTPNPDRVLSFNGSLQRVDEIEAALVSAWRTNPSDEGPAGLAKGVWNGVGMLAVAALAVGLALARRGRGYSEPSSWLAWRAGSFSRWLRAFLPVLSQSELGEGGKAIGSLLTISAIALAPRLFSFGVDLPILAGPPAFIALLIALVGLVLYVAICIRAELAEGK